MEDVKGIINDPEIEIKDKDDVSIAKLKSWKEFLLFESSFIGILCLELFWGRIDGVILSVKFSEIIIATHYSWMNVVCFVDAFSYGWSVSICEKLACHMIAKRTKVAKALSILSIVSMLAIGFILSIFIYQFAEPIAVIMINDKPTQILLVKVFELYSWFIPVCLLQGALYGCLRAIGKQNHIIGAQILSNFIIHYIVMTILFSSWEEINQALVVTFGITYFSMNIYLMIILLLVDWEDAAEVMRKSIGVNALDDSLVLKLNDDGEATLDNERGSKHIDHEYVK